jgi:hypothetical protein
MDRDHFIISVYCLVCHHFQKIVANHPLRRRGFAPALSDEEVITLEVCGEYLGLDQDEAIFDYFVAHYAPWFPHLKERTSFVRQAANLWQVKALIQQRLTWVSGQATDAVQIIDTLPLPVCVYTRSQRDRCFKPDADYGYCAAKDMPYYGFKLGLRISRDGMIVHYPLLPARPHDSQLLDDLIAGLQGVALADKGFIDGFRQQELAKKKRVELITPPRKNRQVRLPDPVYQVSKRWRKLIETVGSHLTERYHIAHTRAHDLWHYQNRLIRKVLSHTICVFINLQLGRSPLDLDDLVAN